MSCTSSNKVMAGGHSWTCASCDRAVRIRAWGFSTAGGWSSKPPPDPHWSTHRLLSSMWGICAPKAAGSAWHKLFCLAFAAQDIIRALPHNQPGTLSAGFHLHSWERQPGFKLWVWGIETDPLCLIAPVWLKIAKPNRPERR